VCDRAGFGDRDSSDLQFRSDRHSIAVVRLVRLYPALSSNWHLPATDEVGDSCELTRCKRNNGVRSQNSLRIDILDADYHNRNKALH
jgi:hypothetical protein